VTTCGICGRRLHSRQLAAGRCNECLRTDAVPERLTASGAAFAAQLERETDRSLRQDPSRWTTTRATDSEERRESGLKAYARDAREAAEES
jgi:hypothetical protein